MNVRAVVLDLDHTLAVPTRSRDDILREALAETGAPRIDRETYLDAHRDNLTAETRAPIFAEAFPDDADVDPAAVAEAYRGGLSDALRPIPGAEGLLATLRDRYRLGLLTDGPTVAQRDKIETLGWGSAFDAILISGELPAGKPDERAFRAALDALDASADETVHVGDDPEADVQGAIDAGLGAVQVLCDRRRHPGADAHVPREDLPERLPDVLEEL